MLSHPQPAVGAPIPSPSAGGKSGSSLQKCLKDLELRPNWRRIEKYFCVFYCLHCAYTETGSTGGGL